MHGTPRRVRPPAHRRRDPPPCQIRIDGQFRIVERCEAQRAGGARASANRGHQSGTPDGHQWGRRSENLMTGAGRSRQRAPRVEANGVPRLARRDALQECRQSREEVGRDCRQAAVHASGSRWLGRGADSSWVGGSAGANPEGLASPQPNAFPTLTPTDGSAVATPPWVWVPRGVSTCRVVLEKEQPARRVRSLRERADCRKM